MPDPAAERILQAKRKKLLSVCVAYRDDLEKELGSDEGIFEKFDEMYKEAEEILINLGMKAADLSVKTDENNIEFRITGLISNLTRVYDRLVEQKIKPGSDGDEEKKNEKFKASWVDITQEKEPSLRLSQKWLYL